MSFAAKFKELRIRQDAREQVISCYQCFSAGTFGFKDYSLSDQLQRAVISAMNNLAEGSKEKRRKNFAISWTRQKARVVRCEVCHTSPKIFTIWLRKALQLCVKKPGSQPT